MLPRPYYLRDRLTGGVTTSTFQPLFTEHAGLASPSEVAEQVRNSSENLRLSGKNAARSRN